MNYQQIRHLAGYTQDEVGELCGVNRRTVARFEKGLSFNKILKTWYDERLDEITENVKTEVVNESC